jgi:hypothetical protein
MKSILSVFLIITTLFSIVFFKMEERRIGYEILKLNQTLRQQRELIIHKETSLLKLTRPNFVEKLAENKLTLKRANPNQFIHMAGVSELLQSLKNDNSKKRKN